jgi:hypothetical protein
MPDLLVRNSTVTLTPNIGWSWYGWDGVTTLTRAPRTVSAAGEQVVLVPDIIAAIAEQTAGKAYTATGFADLPGAVAAVVATVNHATLAQTLYVESLNAVLSSTEGTFIMNVGSPSMMIPPSGTPVADPVPVKNGTWKIKKSEQAEVTVE